MRFDAAQISNVADQRLGAALNFSDDTSRQLKPLDDDDTDDDSLDKIYGLEDDDDEYIPTHDDLAELQAREDRFQQAFLGNDFTMDTRYTTASNVGAGQEIVFDEAVPMAPIGIRNVRPIPRAERESSFDTLPGGFVNPNVKSFYYNQSFGYKVKKSWASENVPWLFGPEGLYPGIYDCPSDCESDDPLCICDEAFRR